MDGLILRARGGGGADVFDANGVLVAQFYGASPAHPDRDGLKTATEMFRLVTVGIDAEAEPSEQPPTSPERKGSDHV